MEDQSKFRQFEEPTKQALMYYKFGAWGRNKKLDYLLQLKSNMIFDLFLLENFPKEQLDSITLHTRWKIINQYHIKELFWNDQVNSTTSNHRKKLWDILINERAKKIYLEKRKHSNFKLIQLNNFGEKFGAEISNKFIDLAVRNKDEDFIYKFAQQYDIADVKDFYEIHYVLHGSHLDFYNYRKDRFTVSHSTNGGTKLKEQYSII
jgi:hypothetical protein